MKKNLNSSQYKDNLGINNLYTSCCVLCEKKIKVDDKTVEDLYQMLEEQGYYISIFEKESVVFNFTSKNVNSKTLDLIKNIDEKLIILFKSIYNVNIICQKTNEKEHLLIFSYCPVVKKLLEGRSIC